jgi:hypothetical protein
MLMVIMGAGIVATTDIVATAGTKGVNEEVAKVTVAAEAADNRPAVLISARARLLFSSIPRNPATLVERGSN